MGRPTPAEAVGFYERALKLLKAEGNDEQAARSLMRLGLAYQTALDQEAAGRAYDEACILWQSAALKPPAHLAPAPHALRMVWDEPPTLDPARCFDISGASVINQLFSGLLGVRFEMDVLPDLAASWDITEAGRRYVFQLRRDAHWSDGTPVTARDLEYAWKRSLDPQLDWSGAGVLYDVRGARDYHRGVVADSDAVGVRALNDATLAIELESPVGYFLHVAAQVRGVPRHAVEAHGKAWATPEHIVTDGPFLLEEWREGERMVLVRNPRYYGLLRGNVQRVELCLLGKKNWPLPEMYEANELDVLDATCLPPADVTRVLRRYATDLVPVPAPATVYLAFDARRPPFDNPLVWRAFALATDRRALPRVVVGHARAATGGLVPPGIPGHSPGIGLPYDPEEARRLLAAAGYPEGRGFPVVELLVATTDGLAEFLQAQWREQLSVEVACELVSLPLLHGRLLTRPAHIYQTGWTADYPDPDNFLRVGLSATRPEAGWHDETYDDLVERARRSMDQPERMALYRQADRLLVEAAPIVPLYYNVSCLLMKPWVRMLVSSAAEVMPRWYDATIEPHG